MSSIDSDQDWNCREDRRPAGGGAIPFPDRDETVWIIRTDWPVANTMGRLTLREYVNGDITIERGRVWIPPPPEEDDGA